MSSSSVFITYRGFERRGPFTIPTSFDSLWFFLFFFLFIHHPSQLFLLFTCGIYVFHLYDNSMLVIYRTWSNFSRIRQCTYTLCRDRCGPFSYLLSVGCFFGFWFIELWNSWPRFDGLGQITFSVWIWFRFR